MLDTANPAKTQAKIREAVARAIFRACHDYAGNLAGWDGAVPRPVCEKVIDAVVAAHKAALAEAGFVIVPCEPTERMLEAANAIDMSGTTNGIWDNPFPDEAWRTMVEAAPGEPE